MQGPTPADIAAQARELLRTADQKLVDLASRHLVKALVGLRRGEASAVLANVLAIFATLDAKRDIAPETILLVVLEMALMLLDRPAQLDS